MTTIDMNPIQTSKGWNIGLWVVQALLAAIFLMAGATKLMSGSAELVAMGMGWAENAPLLLIKFIGFAEIAGALGMILPSVTRIMPHLTKMAAVGLAVIMVLAAGLHITRGEFEVVPMNVILFALAGLVIWGRKNKAPIAPRA
ncbi:DoxX family protein [Rhizobium sp. 'Codium 1']|uniref:DoxX family protein n=1 Tax=Rhizobium sp. 'Codium 1' TaxID=2940484 RepID=UPI001E3A3758|nr:DoxX family protein [Rhizobium sp. 'Codium 1']MCC8934162.1 DoxX family protein [Rhizobium sp. 'Codium 1']